MSEIAVAFLIALLFYVFGLFTDDVRDFLERHRERLAPRDVGLSGYYHTEWDKGRGRPQRELLHVTERRGRVIAEMLFAIDRSATYSAKGTLFMDGQVALRWRNPEKNISGMIHMAKNDTGIYAGRWTGLSPTTRHIIRGDIWQMHRVKTSDVPIPDLHLDVAAHRKVLSDIIVAHEDLLAKCQDGWATSVTIEQQEVALRIQPGVFDPSLGNGSKRLLEYASRLLTPGDVLDLGFGSGVFAIYFAKFKDSRVVGVDTNEAAMYCAAANAELNGVADRCEFLHGDLYAPVYDTYHLTRQFDVVIANLPFSRPRYVKSALRKANVDKNRVDQYREMFSTSRRLLQQVLYGAYFVLKPGGQLLLLTGGSADLDALRAAARLSGLRLSRTGGDIFQGKSEQLMVVALQKPASVA